MGPLWVDFVANEDAEFAILNQEHSQWPRSSVQQRILQTIPDIDLGRTLHPLGPKVDTKGHLYFDFMLFGLHDDGDEEIPLEVVTYRMTEDEHPAKMENLTRRVVEDVVRINRMYHQPHTGVRPSVFFGPSVTQGWMVSVPPTLFNKEWAWAVMDLSGYLGSDQENSGMRPDGTLRWRLVWDFLTGKVYHITQDPTVVRVLDFTCPG